MKKLFTSIFLCCLPFFFFAQNLSGEWAGTIKKSFNEKPFSYEITIENNAGGQSAIKYKDEEWHCQKAHRGSVKNNKYSYEDKRFIIHHHDRGAYWLMVKGTLNYDSEKDKLYGWVDAYDYITKSLYIEHDYVELYRKKENIVTVPNLPTPSSYWTMCSNIGCFW